jgi:putative transcriptional regulator
MSENDTIRARRLPDGSVVQVMEDGSTRPLEDRTDWARVDAMTEEEIEANALADPDNPPLTAEQLARMQPVPNPKQIRQRLRMTQEQFAARFHLRVGTVRDWEQGLKEPDSAAKTLLRVIDKNPEAVIRALES